mgnify:CR=1 FL=1
MPRRFLIFILFGGLALTVLYAPRLNAQRAAGLPNFTIPTPTFMPSATAVPPTAVPPTTAPPTAVPPTAVPTNPPAATATNTPTPVTLVATPSGGFLPTAAACAAPPTIQTRNNTRVRSGPGTDYAAIGNLVFLEVRPIVGRSDNAPWWLIALANGQTGWVANDVVTVQGYIGDVPIVDAPPVNNQTPTPGAAWQPTAVPNCPTSTATPPNPTATQTAVPQATATASATDTVTAVTDDAPSSTAGQALATATSVAPSGAATIESLAVNTQAETPQATAVPLDDAEASGSVAALPCASAMIGVAIAGFFIGRRFW